MSDPTPNLEHDPDPEEVPITDNSTGEAVPAPAEELDDPDAGGT